MKKDKILVPISFFNGKIESKLIEIDIESKEKKEVITYVPDEKFAVKGKGFTQIAYCATKNLILIADYNQCHIIDVDNFEILNSLHSTVFNDIHGVMVYEDLIVLSNTGFDSVEVYNFEGLFVKSVNLLSFEESINRLKGAAKKENDNNYFDNDLNKPFCQRKVKDKFHLNNCNVIDNRLIATSFIKKTLIDLTLFKEIASPLPTYIHDGTLFDNKIWITSVDGKIYYRDKEINTFANFKEYVDLFEIGNYYGWCRGLQFHDKYLYIGITQINSESTNSRWNVNKPIDETSTGVIKMDFEKKEIIDFYDLSDMKISRIFGFIIH